MVELRPLEVSKASALEQVALEKGLRWIVAAGDDSSDVEALDRAGVMAGSRALRVGVSSSEAPEGLAEVSDFLVESPEELVELLRLFLANQRISNEEG